MVSFTCSTHGRKRRIAAGEIVSKADPCQVQGHYYALEYVEAGKHPLVQDVDTWLMAG